MSRRLAPLVLVSGFLASVLVAPRAQAFVYWGNNCGNVVGSLSDTIGRSNNDGSVVDQSFITGVQSPCSTRVDGQHIYWASVGPATRGLGRASIDGTGLENSFIPISSANSPRGVDVDGTYIYFACGEASNCGRIDRADLNGTNVVKPFITTGGLTQPCGVAVDDAHVWWASPGSNSIGRADLNGANPDNLFITGTTAACGVISDGTYVYWTNTGGSTIGRAKVDGSEVDQAFLTGGNSPCGIDFDATYLYWANFGNGTISRAGPGGVEANFITGAFKPCGVAVDDLCCLVAQYTLSVAKTGSGTGSITSAPTGIDCGATCSHDYDDGTSVTLTATAADGSSFDGWSGGGCSGTGTCVLTIHADTPLTATFTANPPPPPPIVPASLPQLPALPATLGLIGSPSVHGDRALLHIACNGAATQSCTGSATATTTETLAADGHTVKGLTATVRKRRSLKVVVGRTNFSVPGGQTRTVTLKLNAKGKRLLKRFKRLPARVVVSTVDAAGKRKIVASAKVKFRARRAR